MPLQLIVHLPQVEACAVTLHGNSRLLAFIVAATPAEPTDAPRLPSEGGRLKRAEEQEETGGADGDPRQLILNQLSLLLPSHSVPDTLLLVAALPRTAHGERRTHCGAASQCPHLPSQVCLCWLCFR